MSSPYILQKHKLRGLLLSALVGFSFSLASTFAEPPAQSTLSAMQALPVPFHRGILQVIGKNGSPAPENWQIIARNSELGGAIQTFTITDGQILSQHASSNLGQMFRESGYLLPEQPAFDWHQVYDIAKKYAAANGLTISAVNYSLSRSGDSEPPVWTVDCLNAEGKSFAKLQILATTGTVLFHNGFPKHP